MKNISLLAINPETELFTSIDHFVSDISPRIGEKIVRTENEESVMYDIVDIHHCARPSSKDYDFMDIFLSNRTERNSYLLELPEKIKANLS